MSRVTIRKSIYLKWGQLFKYATADHYKQVLTGSTERHKRTEVMLPRLVREGKLRTFKHGRVLVYAVPRYTQGQNIFVEHGLACTEGLVRFWRSDMSGVIIPERFFRGLGSIPEWGIIYPNNRMILFEFCSSDNFHRARLIEGKVKKYLRNLPDIENKFKAETVVVFVADVKRADVERLVARINPTGPFFFTDYEAFLQVPNGQQLTAAIYIWGENGNLYPLRKL